MSTFLAAVTYYLLTTPDTYLKLRQEIRTRYSDYDEIDATSSLQLPYLQAVINEGLRIYPPGPQGFPRVSPGAVVDDVYVPAGVNITSCHSSESLQGWLGYTQAEVYTSSWTVMHDPRNFHEPFQFKPERWTDPNCSDTKEASQPFSLGPRACVGQKLVFFSNLGKLTEGRNPANLAFRLSSFALMEISLIMAKMHWMYDLDLVNKKLDWEGQSHMHILWWKPALNIRFSEAHWFCLVGRVRVQFQTVIQLYPLQASFSYVFKFLTSTAETQDKR